MGEGGRRVPLLECRGRGRVCEGRRLLGLGRPLLRWWMGVKRFGGGLRWRVELLFYAPRATVSGEVQLDLSWKLRRGV